MDSGAPYLWMAIVAVVLLGLALGYGAVMYRKRSRDPVLQQIRDEETRRNYERPDGS